MNAQRRYESSDFEWSIIEPLLPNKPRGVPRADDRKVLNGICWRLRTSSPLADIPERYGPATTVYNRFVRCRDLRPSPPPAYGRVLGFISGLKRPAFPVRI